MNANILDRGDYGCKFFIFLGINTADNGLEKPDEY